MAEGLNGLSLAELDALPAQARVLDFGCGQGEVSRMLLARGHRVVAADVDPRCEAALRHGLSAEAAAQLEFVLLPADGGVPALLAGPFDAVICREVLEHVADPARVFGLLAGRLAPRGWLVVSVPTAWSERWFSRCDPDWMRKSDHRRIFGRDELRRLFADNRLELRREEGRSFRWTLLWLLLAPFRVRHRMGNPESHPRLVAWALRLMRAVCAVPGLERLGDRLLPKSRFYYGAPRKPRVLLVYDYPGWILARWAEHIARVHGAQFEFDAIGMFEAGRERARAAALAARADLVHLLLPHAWGLFRGLAPGARVVATIHHWIDGAEDWEAPLRGAERLVTGAQYWRARLAQRGVPPERICVVHSGIEDRFLENPAPLLDSSAKLSCGFFAKDDSNEADRKGTRHLRALAASLRARGVHEHYRIVVTGPGWEALVAELRATGLETVYRGRVADADMPALYRSLDAYLMLSDVEGGPVTIAEAMASGCLVFATGTGVAPEFVEDGVTGVRVDTAHIEALAGRLEYFRAHPAERRAIGERARRFAAGRLRWDATLAPLGALYGELTRINTAGTARA